MYSRQFSKEPVSPDVPCGYGGNAFSHPSDVPPTPQEVQTEPDSGEERATEASAFRPLKSGLRFPSFISRFFDGCGFGKGFDFKGLLSGDLLLVAVAVLLLTGDNDSCEEKDDDLWLLLILLYFMK